MAKKKHKKKVETASFVEIEKDFGLWEDYMAFGPQYDTVNDCPLIPGETECVQELPFKKLSAETRKALRSAMVNRVVEYWQSERLIPESSSKNCERRPFKKLTSLPDSMPRTVMKSSIC